jgi:hypothetical protein
LSIVKRPSLGPVRNEGPGEPPENRVFSAFNQEQTMPVLSDTQWAKFEAVIAAVKIPGARPRKEDRRTIEAII